MRGLTHLSVIRTQFSYPLMSPETGEGYSHPYRQVGKELNSAAIARTKCDSCAGYAPGAPMKQKRLSTLKRVSGKLRRMWNGREEAHSSEFPMPRLLIVDDEEAICFSMSEYFSLHGFKVDTARELDEVEKLLGSTAYRVIIQDLQLSAKRDSDGLDVIRMIRGQNPDAKIIVLTAYGSVEMEDEAKRCGADAFLRKPKPLSQVAQVVQGLLETQTNQAVRHA
jgi:CheY-like chemotaxis protein